MNTETHQPAQNLRRRWSTADGDQRRALIVAVALRLLADEGEAAVTMRRVAGELGVGTMTLYTYFEGQPALRKAMIREGFAQLRQYCQAGSTLGTSEGWRGGARRYVHFALEHPNLYRLMFSSPADADDAEEAMASEEYGLASFNLQVAEQMRRQGRSDPRLEEEARIAAARCWIALHGLASLGIDGRLGMLGNDVEGLLDTLLQRVAPT